MTFKQPAKKKKLRIICFKKGWGNNDDYKKKLKSGKLSAGQLKVIYNVRYYRYYLGVNVSL